MGDLRALSGLFTVMAKQEVADPGTGATKTKVTALICSPDMEGVGSGRNRQVRHPRNLAGTDPAQQRQGPGRESTAPGRQGPQRRADLPQLRAMHAVRGHGGAGSYAYEQALKWATYRYQFQRPIADFAQMQEKLARMAS